MTPDSGLRAKPDGPEGRSLLAGRNEKAMTVRLSAEQYEFLRMLARVNRRSISDELRAALAAYIAERKGDPAFAARARVVADEWRSFADTCGVAA